MRERKSDLPFMESWNFCSSACTVVYWALKLSSKFVDSLPTDWVSLCTSVRRAYTYFVSISEILVEMSSKFFVFILCDSIM